MRVSLWNVQLGKKAEPKKRKRARFLTLINENPSFNKRPVKPVSWCYKMIQSIYDDKVRRGDRRLPWQRKCVLTRAFSRVQATLDNAHDRDHMPRFPMPEYLLDWVTHKYGIKTLCDQVPVRELGFASLR